MAIPLRVFQAARAVADEIESLLLSRRPSLLHRAQLRDAAQSISANIREGTGRGPGPDRNRFYRFARSSADETDEHLRANLVAGRLPTAVYWRLHHRLVLIGKMLDSMTA
jgi:four helix bundle protein